MFLAQPLHWIYNLNKLDTIVGSRKDSLEFWEPSQNPFYTIQTGRGTAYADQLIALLESLVACEGSSITSGIWLNNTAVNEWANKLILAHIVCRNVYPWTLIVLCWHLGDFKMIMLKLPKLYRNQICQLKVVGSGPTSQ